MPFSNFDSNRDLRRALANLEAFSQQIEKEPFPNLSHLNVQDGKIVSTKEGSLNKVISLAYNFIGLPFEDEEITQKVLAEVEESINVVKRYYHTLESMEEGSVEQQKFAAYAKQEIARFNKIVEQTSNPSTPPTLTGRIFHFIYQQRGLWIGKKLKKIHLPEAASRRIYFPPPPQPPVEVLKIAPKKNCEATFASSQKIASLHEAVMPSWQISRQTLDLYAMKVIALLGQHALNHYEARTAVDKTAKEMHINRQEQLLTISQRLMPIPGHIFDVAISFRADPLTSAFTIPVPPYQITPSAQQTGFPHALQNHGWALSDFLIPTNVNQPQELPLLSEFQQNKQQMAIDLQFNATFLEKNKELLRAKRAIFKREVSLFLNLHQELMIAIATAAPHFKPTRTYANTFTRFFHAAASSPYPYDYIADANQLAIECTTSRLQKRLEAFWLDVHSLENLTVEIFKVIFQDEFNMSLQELEAKKEKSDNANEKVALDYCIVVSQLLFPAIGSIVLQQYSDVMKTPLPPLNLFEQKMQIALYNQLETFQNELKMPMQGIEMKEHLKRLIEEDIALFKASDLSKFTGKAFATCQELNRYANALQRS